MIFLFLLPTSVLENIHGIPFNRIFKLLQSFRELRYRDVHLLTSISDYVASSLDIWTNKQVTAIF